MQNQPELTISTEKELAIGTYDDKHYEALLGTELFIDHFVKNNQKVGFSDRIMLIDYIRNHAGVWNHPGDVESVEDINHRVVIHHRTGEVHITMPVLKH